MSVVTQDKDIQAVIRLVELTNKGEVKWHSISKPTAFVDSDDTSYGTAFIGSYEGFTLRIFSWQSRNLQLKSGLGGLLGRAPGSDSLYEYVWHRNVILQIVDKEGQLLWSFPTGSVVDDLYDAVRAQVSGASRLISKLTS